MKRITTMFTALALVTTIAACGKKKEGEGGGGGGDKAPAVAINEADWAVKDLKTVAPMVHVSMKVPKDAKLEKNGNGGVDVRVNDAIVLTVSTLAVSNIDEAKKSDKSLTVDNKSSYINTKVVTDEPNGFVYTIQMKDEANGNKYEPESHFAVYLEKDGAFYSILDARPMENFSLPGSTYTLDNANKMYGIIKGSAKAE